MADGVVLSGSGLTPEAVHAIAVGHVGVELEKTALEAVGKNRAALDAAIERGDTIYGVTTGLGALAREQVSLSEAAAAQRDVLRSHAAGVGAPLPAEVVRAALAVRVNGLLRARSGIRPVILKRLAEFLNEGLIPAVPRTGSLGASGDLAPSAHALLPLLGEGELLDETGRAEPAHWQLAARGLEPIELAPKEGLALVNGTHFMAGAGALATVRAGVLLDSADAVAALSLEALRGAAGAFDPRVHELRGLEGQARSAANVRALVAGSARVGSEPERVQDAYSLRCVPQVHGAAREALTFFAKLVGADLDAVTDNPIVFDDPVEVVSAGNFHGQSLALAFDALRIALADLASISDRRTFRLLSPSLSGGLPAFLTPTPGRSSGLMVAQYTGAALVAELRALAAPVSADSVPTSDNQEDHVSMGWTGALLTLDALERLASVVAIEALCAAQALELVGSAPGEGTARLAGLVREHVPPLVEDRPPAPDIERLRALLEAGALAVIVRELNPEAGR